MREKSFRRKLLALIILAVGGGQALMTVFVLWGEAERYAANKRDLLLAQAQVLAAAVSEATARGDAARVYAALRAAGSLSEIQFVSVSDHEGNRIAGLGAAELLANDLVIDRTSTVTAWQLLRARSFALRAPIVQGGASVGTVVLIGDAGDLKENLIAGLMNFAGAAAAALSFALAITLRLQRILTQPLMGLVRAMQTVAASHDYALSAPQSEISELKILTDGFNGMLVGIRERDKQIARNFADLEGQVQERTRELRAAKEAAEASKAQADEANAHKSRFLATMSHEIRTPMNGVLAMAELLTHSPLSPTARRYADVIWRSGKSLLAIINDVLDFSKIEAGKLELERAPLDLAEIVTTVLDLFGPKAREKGLDLAARIDVHAPRSIVGDSVRLTQILSNLVNNALKFTDRGGVRLIVATGAAPNSVKFEVEDTGVGVPSDRLHAIFGAFSQADMSTTRKYGGTGLGLAICQRLAQAMSAEIGVASVEGSGSIFSFTLQDCAEAFAQWPAGEFAGAKILVCAHGEFTRDVLAHYGSSAGFPIVFAQPGEIAGQVRAGDIVVVEGEDATTSVFAQVRHLGARVIGVGNNENGPSEEPEAMLSWPIARPEFEALLQALFAGRPLREAKRTEGDRLSGRFPGLQVLVADDNEVNREVAKEAMERLGAIVTLVSDGLQAVAAQEAARFDVLMLDGSMPVLSGFDAARKIRRQEAATGAKRTPILAFTAHVLGVSATEWQDAGMDGLVAKPFTLEELARGVESALGVAAFPRSLETPPVAAVERPVDLIDRKALDELERISSGDLGFFTRVVRLYTMHAPEAVDAIKRHGATGDLGEVAKAAHALKSMSLNMGATAAAKSAARLEASATDGTLPTADDLRKVESAVSNTCALLVSEVKDVKKTLRSERS